MFSNFDLDVIWRSLRFLLLEGMTFTLTLTVLASVGGIILGTFIALMRVSGILVLDRLAAIYVNVVRALPLVLVIFWFYYLVPYLGAWATGSSRPVQVGAFASALITFTMFEAAYFAEIVRSGIKSVGRGQKNAGLALGLSGPQSMFYIVLPQAFRNMTPVFLTQVIILFQDTSLVYVASLTDFLGAAAKVAQRDGRLVELYIFAALIYFAISFSCSLFVKKMRQGNAMLAPH